MALGAGQACAGEVPGLVLLPRLVPHELVAAGNQITHGLLRERRRRFGLDVVEVDELSDDSGVDAVRLGQDAGGAGVVANVAGVEDDEGELGLSERVGEGTFVAAGGLEGDEAGVSVATVLDEGSEAVRGGLESPGAFR